MSTPLRHYPVQVMPHAKHRARERFPGFKCARISDEVRLALAAGRLSTSKPPGIYGPDDPAALYVWTEDGIRVYALHHSPSTFAVMTCMKAYDDA